ncbi:3-phosphoglycerate kinase [Pseudomonas frederiksbergensis]|uniref:3-phosphoglycerate kinase n=1 Tax=Pseudomonas frederiksbergensis TaxID=104087 RepID=A0A423KJS1_9PSED|nr:3-phosphoglycerate kinase [Pseudomonas frederiksbergensis]RON53401.1 3-phosphoglycerate kinase [Pseudomonas frederiksbergensis]
MKKFCLVVLAMLPLTAFAYPIDVQKQLNGMSIDYNAYDTDNDIASIQVNNYGATDAVCKVVFNNGPESPRTRTIEVPAGKHKNATAKFTRTIIKMRINLSCTPK